MDTDNAVLASDKDRDAACKQINAAFSEGRLTTDEREEWTSRTLQARTRGELRRLIADLPNPELPELPPRPELKTKSPKVRKPVDWDTIGMYTFMAFVILFIIGLLSYGIWALWPVSPGPMPTPAASITDSQDRAFVQMMITYHNTADQNPDLYDDRNPYQDIDETEALEIAHQIRDLHNDIRQEFLLVMGSTAFRHLTMHERYYAGKTAVSIWRADQEAIWAQLGKDQGFEQS